MPCVPNPNTGFWRGQISQETLGNGVVTTRSFDAVTGWVSGIQSGVGGGSSLQNESYLSDLVGNLTQRQNNNVPTMTENFYYDHLYRLTQSTLGGTQNLAITYDALGNITSRSDVASGATWNYHATKKHAVTQAGNASYVYTYDANGNAATRYGNTLTWSKYNYPTVITGPGKTLNFSYDANHQRYKQIYANGSLTETTMYVGGLLEKVTIGTLVDYRHYIRVGSQTIAVMSRQSTGTNTTRYLLEDHQGSVATITDGAGTSYVKENFTAFGGRRDPATWSGPCPCPDLAKIAGVSRIGYTGHEAIGGISMGLNHMNGRVQDAITGRFLSADPYITEPGNTQNYNRYSYVYNNPLSFTDPSGFCTTGGYDANSHDLMQSDCFTGPGLIEWIDGFSQFLYDLMNETLSGQTGSGTFFPVTPPSPAPTPAPDGPPVNNDGVTGTWGGTSLGHTLTEAIVPGAAYFASGYAAEAQGRYLAALGWHTAGHLEVLGTVATAGMGGVVVGTTREANGAGARVRGYSGRGESGVVEMVFDAFAQAAFGPAKLAGNSGEGSNTSE